MIWNTTVVLLGAATPPAGQGQESTSLLHGPLVPMVIFMVAMYFVLLRPQQKKAREHQELLKGLRSGDKVVTNGGVVGVVITVKEKTATIRSADTKIEILKTAVAEITERGSEVKEA